MCLLIIDWSIAMTNACVQPQSGRSLASDLSTDWINGLESINLWQVYHEDRFSSGQWMSVKEFIGLFSMQIRYWCTLICVKRIPTLSRTWSLIMPEWQKSLRCLHVRWEKKRTPDRLPTKWHQSTRCLFLCLSKSLLRVFSLSLALPFWPFLSICFSREITNEKRHSSRLSASNKKNRRRGRRKRRKKNRRASL